MAVSRLQTTGYAGVIVLCFLLGMLAGWNGFGLARRIDNQKYDLLSQSQQGPAREAVVVAIDEATLAAMGERNNLRKIVAAALHEIRQASPKAVAIDVVLAGGDTNPALDAALETEFRSTPNLVLGSTVMEGRGWENPSPRFAAAAAGVGHFHYEVNPGSRPTDGVTREIALEQVFGHDRRWALALEAFAVAHHADILESPDDLEVGSVRIPAQRAYGQRPMYIRYLPENTIPTISVLDLPAKRETLRDKVVFLGVTAQSMARDRLKIPSGETFAGVEVHAHAYETLARGEFLVPASASSILLICAGLAVAIGALFGFLTGWRPYVSALPLLIGAFYLPNLFLHSNVVFPLVAPAAVTWLCAAGAATYQHFVIRRTLKKTEAEKARYQQAIHWAAHEMRTPLTAIQGSSELMTRYKLPEEKQGQLSEMIHSESKRLARIIQTFLDVERLAEGQMELKREPFSVADLIDICMQRAAPLAERKQIQMTLDEPLDGAVLGDRELMEYAFYNLLTNAVKYSPSSTHVRVRGARNGRELRLSVADQGMGMTQKELKSIFKKFYRTKSAEKSGEAGTGIGLSIVEQIVTHHGGRMEVTSEPGKGSCFTMILLAK